MALEALGQILGRYTGFDSAIAIADLILPLPLLGAVAIPRRASREGAMVFAFSHPSRQKKFYY